MAQSTQWPYDQSLIAAAISQYGRPEQYFEDRYFWPPDRLRRLQDARVRQEVTRAATIPFYRRRWDAAGFDPSKFRGLEDLHRIPAYTVHDIRESLERRPPFGDYQGVTPGPGVTGLRMYFSGGTTGNPRPTVYTVWDRLVGSLTVARHMYLHGCRPGQVVVNSWSYGTHNAAWISDEALWLWLGCTPITASTGVVTSSVKQLELARDYGATSIFTTADYLIHLRKTADEMGLKPQEFNLGWFSTIGDLEGAMKAWGIPAYEFYAFHEVQSVAAECLDRGGMHVFEDAFVVEVVDSETGESLPSGQTGDLVVTCLYKSGSPQIRYNIKDLSRILPGTCRCGSATTRIGRLEGRSDTMIKLRGINVWPEAVGSVLEEVLREHVEYFCVAHRMEDQDQLIVLFEGAGDPATLEPRLSQVLRDRLGVKLDVRQVGAGALDTLTGKGQVAKLRRFQDERQRAQLSEVAARLMRY